MKRVHENGSKNKCDLGVLWTSKTRSVCRPEHDCRFLTLPRKNLILEWFWTLILELLGTPFAEKKVSREVWKLLGFLIDFLCILDPQNGSKIDEKSILGLMLGQDGSKEVSSWANMTPRTDFHLFFDRFFNHFRLMSDRFWIDICSFQGSILTYFWIDFRSF